MYIPCYAFFKSFKIDNIKIESFKISKIENATSKNLNEEEQGLSENEEFDSLKCYILLIFFFNIWVMLLSDYILSENFSNNHHDEKCRF